MIRLKKSRIKKFMAGTLATILIAGALSGCSTKSKETKNVSVKEISKKVVESIDTSNMKKEDGNKLEKLYGIKPEDVEEFTVYSPKSNLKADEIAIIKAKDSNDVDKIKEKIEERIKKQESSFKDYLPDEYFLIEKHVLKTNGNYIFLAISKDAEKAENAFDESIK
ncbi:hypothetical protein CLPU_6c00730 [Gottschalkia purinilytica]|uniref:DUF4358 domain-containing protein n=1 Tax=Gottschalkia purinilytica TaxID=1503 RepID=A0A0L0WAV7_GOTPU|nr:DUF4358 domain-containing protein [Gottschalkia purinilytica]KNF08587.1 hypothetical protein CLPU_6c00730 [Gottschalkia purinilytica]